MKNDPSLHLVLLRDSAGCEGYGLDYQQFHKEVRKYLPHGEISESGWYIISGDDDAEIKQNLSKFLPDLPSDHQAGPNPVRVVGGSVVGSSKKETKPTRDPLSQRLFVVRVYHPANKDMVNPDMKALYDKLMENAAPSAQAQTAAE